MLGVCSRARTTNDGDSRGLKVVRLLFDEQLSERLCFNPTRDYLEPRLQGLELSAVEYRRLPGRELADGTLALASGVLGLELRLTERGLRFHDPATGQDLPNLAETDEARQRERQARRAAETRLAQEEAARRQEEAARAAAEARVAELEALLRRERGSDSVQDGNRPAPH